MCEGAMKTLKIGDTVISKHGVAEILKIELCEKPGHKYGIDVKEIYVDLVDRCVFDLNNGHFAYGDQIDFVSV